MDGATTSAPVVAAAPPARSRLTTFLHALLFVLGFSAVFVIGWGGAVTMLGQLFYAFQKYLALVGGVVVILFGLATLRVIRIPWLYYDTRPRWQGQGAGQGKLMSSAMMGVFFAAGWTPCVGTTLGAILTLGLSQDTSGQAILLSSGYALGMAVPFLLIGLGLGRASDLVRRFRRHLRSIEIFNGVFLIAIGILMLTGSMKLIATWALRSGLYLDGDALLTFGRLGEGLYSAFFAGRSPTYGAAIIAGLLSFFSPCVLPLVPAYMGYLGGHAIMGAAQQEKIA